MRCRARWSDDRADISVLRPAHATHVVCKFNRTMGKCKGFVGKSSKCQHIPLTLKESKHIFSLPFKIFKTCLEIFVRDILEIFLFFSIVQRTIWHYAGKMDTLAPLWSLHSTFRGLGQKMELGLIKSFLLAKPYAQISYLTRSFFSSMQILLATAFLS